MSNDDARGNTPNDGSKAQDGEQDQMNRRRFMQTAAAAGAAVAMGAGTASAATAGLDFEDGPVPNPTISGPVTVETHERANMTSALEYINDSGEIDTLADHGGQLATVDEGEVNNPITLRADRIDAEDFYRFPRDETYTDADGDEQDLNALERVSDWSTSGSVTVTETEAASGGPALAIAGDGLTDGSTGTATFSNFEPIESGVLRKYLQLGVNVTALPSGSTVTVRLKDSEASDSVAVTIDPSADETTTSVVATTTTTGTVYQVQVGELTSSLERVDTVEVEVADADAAIDLWAFNAERTSRWQLGKREYKNSDDELETETVYQNDGTYSVTGLDTLGDVFDEAIVKNVEIAAEFTSSGIPEDLVEYEFSDLDHPSYSREMRLGVNRQLPTAYELTYGSMDMTADTELWPEQYATLEVAKDHSGTVDLEDTDDVDMVDRSDAPGDKGSTYTLASTLSPGSTQFVYYVLRLDKSTEKEMKVSGGPGRRSSGGGGFWSSTRGMLAGIAAGVVGFFAMIRSNILG